MWVTYHYVGNWDYLTPITYIGKETEKNLYKQTKSYTNNMPVELQAKMLELIHIT